MSWRLILLAIVSFGVHYATYGCTGFVVYSTDGVFVRARSMELPFSLRSKIIAVPRGYAYAGTAFKKGSGLKWNVKYGFVAINGLDLPQALDGINEKGLSIGLLYFADFASYPKISRDEEFNALAPWELGTWILSSFSSVDEVIQHLNDIKIPLISHSFVGGVIGIHCFVIDKTGRSIVIEPLDEKLKVFEDPIGVMTNEPPFDWQMINLQNYVSPCKQSPCDLIPAIRFTRVALFSQWAQPVTGADQAVLQGIRLMNQFFIFTVKKPLFKVPAYDYTQWESFTDVTNLRYYLRTRDNMNIRVIDLKHIKFDSDKILSCPLEKPMTYQDVASKLK